ncbi:hypothetical protein X975_03195, partial [Stegodyphus mimosarum]
MVAFISFVLTFLIYDIAYVLGQFNAPYDFASKTQGERSDELSPAAIAGVSFAVVAIFAALVVTILFCYYVHRKQKQEEHAPGSFLASRAGY